MTVVIHPTNHTVFAHDAVLDVVEGIASLVELVSDAGRDPLIVIWVNHPTKREAGEALEVVDVVAAKDATDDIVCIEKFFFIIGLIDEEAAGMCSPNCWMTDRLCSLRAKCLLNMRHSPRMLGGSPSCGWRHFRFYTSSKNHDIRIS